jgi:hypothetical protein
MAQPGHAINQSCLSGGAPGRRQHLLNAGANPVSGIEKPRNMNARSSKKQTPAVFPVCGHPAHTASDLSLLNRDSAR